MQVSYLEVGARRSLWPWLEARPAEQRAAEAAMAETCGGRGRRWAAGEAGIPWRW